MTDLFIHIGAPKTGTTAIQQYLLKNRDGLARQGVLYPTGGLLKSAHHVIGAAIFPGRSSRLGAVTRDEALSKSFREIRQEMDERKPRTVILSTEYLWGELSSSNIRRLLQPFEDLSIKIIAYVRRQDLLAQSLYVQAVKTGTMEAFPAWLKRVVDGEKAGFDFHKVLSSWKNSGVAADIVVRVYEKSQLQGDVCSDFMATVCPEATSIPPATDHVANSGPDRTTVELLRLVSTAMGDHELASSVRKRVLAHSPARSLFAPLNYLPSGEVDAFLGRYAEQNAAVARDFLNRNDGVLFHEQRPAASAGVVEEVATSAVLDRLVKLLPILVGAAGAGDALEKRIPRQPERKVERKRGGIGSL